MGKSATGSIQDAEFLGHKGRSLASKAGMRYKELISCLCFHFQRLSLGSGSCFVTQLSLSFLLPSILRSMHDKCHPADSNCEECISLLVTTAQHGLRQTLNTSVPNISLTFGKITPPGVKEHTQSEAENSCYCYCYEHQQSKLLPDNSKDLVHKY